MTGRRNYTPLITAVVVLVIGSLTSLRLFDALLVALVAYVLVVVGTASGAGDPDPWRPARAAEADGTRGEVSALTWSFFGRDDRVSEVAVRRLRTDADRRLARRGVVLPGGLGARTTQDVDPALCDRARELLGDRAWTTLTGPGGLMPSILDIAHCVDVIEAIAPDHPSGAPHRNPVPEGTS